MTNSIKKSEILIVDDIPGNLNYISDILNNEGFSILVATNGRDAIDIALERIPDLILLDIAMPVMDGYEVCKILKSETHTSEIPIIFLTARDDHEDILKGFQAGAVDYISKPFNTSELISRVNTHLELKRKSKELKELNQALGQKVAERTAQLQELNNELTAANHNLSKAYLELSKLDKLKNEFIRHINHELRTPLQGISGFVRLLSPVLHDQEEKEYLQSIEMLLKRLIKVSELSLLFTEIKTENYQLSMQQVSLSECVNDTIRDTDLQGRNVRIVAAGIPADIHLMADEKLLKACIGILIDNAVKFSPDNGEVKIKTEIRDEKMIIEISDNGPGLSDKARNQIFGLFTADNINEEYYGFGIGLATAKMISDLLSAQIEIENKDKNGTVAKLIFSR
ncbi:MAG: hybrid sensor histidine kinase/response regulator [Bacteroidales bacterium]|nr:hybrid sensor histidine kinase/response regulator [Bacteroidales bacterium]